jgi:hypothetical protein
MKSIKIITENLVPIQIALNAANGNSKAHTLCRSADVLDVANDAERRLTALVGSKKHMVGCKATYRSGEALPNAYKYPRHTTRLSIERRSSGWYLTEVVTFSEWRSAGGLSLFLTQEQDAIVIKKARSNYGIQGGAV